MAKHKGRKYRRYLRGNIDLSVDLGTLAANTLISGDVPGSVNERTLISSVVATHTLSAVTPATDRGPCMIGVAHSDYTDAEIEAWVVNDGSWNEGNKVSQEIAKRKIRRIGILGLPNDPADTFELNDGKPVKTKLNWILLQGQTIKFWVRNEGSVAFATTDPDYDINGHANLWPRG